MNSDECLILGDDDDDFKSPKLRAASSSEKLKPSTSSGCNSKVGPAKKVLAARSSRQSSNVFTNTQKRSVQEKVTNKRSCSVFGQNDLAVPKKTQLVDQKAIFTHHEETLVSVGRTAAAAACTSNEPVVEAFGSCNDHENRCICGKDISQFDSRRKLQHWNNCLNEQETSQKFDKLLSAYKSTRDCPLCQKPLQPTGPFRIAHLKKCASDASIPTARLIQLIDVQDRVAQIRSSKGLPHTNAPMPALESIRETARRKNKLKLPKSQFDEELQLAIALSKSEAVAAGIIPDEDALAAQRDQLAIEEKLLSVKQEDLTPLMVLTATEKHQLVEARLRCLLDEIPSKASASSSCATAHISVLPPSTLLSDEYGADLSESRLWSRPQQVRETCFG